MAKEDVAGQVRSSRLVALLTGDDALDEDVRQALSGLGVEVLATSDPAEAEQASSTDGTLWVVDAANHRVSIGSFVRELADGRVLLLVGAGAALPDQDGTADHYLARPFQARTLRALCEHLLREMEVETGGAADSASPAVLARAPSLFASRSLYTEASGFVQRVLDDVRAGRKPRLDESRILAEKIHTSMLQSNRLLLRALEPYERFELPAHCVNVSLLAGKVAMGLGWGVERVIRAVQAGLLHDIGMARLPDRVLHKEGKLSEEEWELVRQHPTHGAEIVEPFGEEYEWLRLAIVQEHERMNGQGYPAGLSGSEIDGLAQVLAVADVFEAFSHPRTYRSPFTSYEALEQVVGLKDESLSGEVVAALVDEISAFPLDSFVLLSTGEIGRVVSTNPTNMMRPVVETVWDVLWQPVDESRTVDLSESTAVSVARPLHETELPIT